MRPKDHHTYSNINQKNEVCNIEHKKSWSCSFYSRNRQNSFHDKEHHTLCVNIDMNTEQWKQIYKQFLV
jgi:hypothetical protein